VDAGVMVGADVGSEAAPVVSIITVTYGTGPVVLEMLDAVARYTPVTHEVIVVDNLPGDGRTRTAELLVSRSDVQLIEADENFGFSGGNNLGAHRAAGEFLCFLNADVIVADGWLEPLLAALDDPIVGIAAPVLVDPDGSLQEAGQLLYPDGCTAAVGGPEVMRHDLSQAFSRDVDYASAACWLVRRDEFLALGGFDERYRPAYFEDVDYALRLEQVGQRTRLVAGTPVVHHHGKATTVDAAPIAERSRDTLRAIWADRLTRQPPRPNDDTSALTNRDRLVLKAGGWAAPVKRSTATARSGALADARHHALQHPRDRVVFATDDADGLDVVGARRDGVEVVVGPVGEAVAARPFVADWHEVVSATRRIPPVIRSLWSPWTAMVAVVGIVLRWLILESPAGVLNADEAYTGLATLGVLDGRFPVVIDGNRYSAVLEAYIFAPVLGLTGPSILVLKLIPIIFWAVAAVLMYLAGSYLAGRRVGAVAGALVWITPGALLVVSTLAYVSYALGMAIAVATLLMAARVIDRDRPSIATSASLGALAGLGFYVHPMYVAVLLPLTLPVAWHHRRSIRAFWLPFAGAGIVVNLPFVAWNAVNGFPSTELQNGLPGTYTDRLDTFFRELIPRGYGLRDISFEWVFGRNLGWLAYAALAALVVVGCVGLVRRDDRRSRWLVPITLIAVWPLMALFSPLIWSADGRYNVISFPFIVMAVAGALMAIPSVDARWSDSAAAAMVVVWGVVFVWPHTSDVVAQRSTDPNGPLHELVDFLDTEGIEQVAGSYWRVLTVEYGSDRRIIGAVSPPDPVRFPDRQRTVQESPPKAVAFVFPPWAEDTSKLWMPPESYERLVVGDTVVYLPLARS
jgi:GT2 family glycosyltransferase